MRLHLKSYLNSVQMYETIETALIRPSKFQIRTGTSNIQELAHSIRQVGLLQPIIVRPTGNVFEIVCGHRRFIAVKSLKVPSVNCLVMKLSDKDAYELSLVENIQNETLNPIDEARAFRFYIDEFGWGGVSDLAKRIGKSEEYVSHRTKLLNLPREVIDMLASDVLVPSVAEELAGMSSDQNKIKLAKATASKKLTVKSVSQVKKLVESGLTFDDAVDEVMSQSSQVNSKNASTPKALEKAILILRIALVRIDSLIDRESNEKLMQLLLENRYQLHQQIDALISYKRHSGIDTAEREDKIYLTVANARSNISRDRSMSSSE